MNYAASKNGNKLSASNTCSKFGCICHKSAGLEEVLIPGNNIDVFRALVFPEVNFLGYPHFPHHLFNHGQKTKDSERAGGHDSIRAISFD